VTSRDEEPTPAVTPGRIRRQIRISIVGLSESLLSRLFLSADHDYRHDRFPTHPQTKTMSGALPSHGRGRRFDPCIAHHPVRANRLGFLGDKNSRNSGRLASRGRSANRIPAVLPRSAPEFPGQSLPAKFGFPSWTMEATGPNGVHASIASASCRRQRGSAEFGSNLEEVCQGFNPTEVAKILHGLGMLESGENGELARKQRLPNNQGTQRFYVLSPSIFEGWED
jgi:hypothetical protein